ncbi:hypothetical protein KG091_04440 [Carnobacteriaceae bacterium zg-ZUI78]|nr:hypothetical protein [Carnobacteriaceae bacterium zg-ZUI78]
MKTYIDVNGQSIPLSGNAKTIFLYKREFKRDFFGDLLKMAKNFSALEKINTGKQEEHYLKALSTQEIEEIDMDILYQFLWAFAKTEDNHIPGFLDFIEQFSSMNLEDVANVVVDLIEHLMHTKKK